MLAILTALAMLSVRISSDGVRVLLLLIALAVTESDRVAILMRLRVLYHQVRMVLADLGMACVSPTARVLRLMVRIIPLEGGRMEVRKLGRLVLS